MKRKSSLLLAVAAVAVAAIPLAGAKENARSAVTAQAPKPCCFTNERFAGVCRVIPTKDETCDGIEAYLNNPSSSGKTYCDSTTLRGGWTRADCATGKPMESPPTPPAERRNAAPRAGAPGGR